MDMVGSYYLVLFNMLLIEFRFWYDVNVVVRLKIEVNVLGFGNNSV